MRVDKEPWTDKRVRQALAFTIDRDKLVQALFQGKAAPGNDHIFSPAFGVPVRVPKRTQNYSKAKHLLDAAGHGGGLQVTLTTENYLEIPQLVTIVKQMAKPAGIDIKLEIEDQGKYYGSGKNQPWLDVPLGLVDWGNRPVPSPYINLAYRCGAIWNSAHWCNRQFSRLAIQLDATVDESKRSQIATRMAKIQQDATPAIIPYWIPRLRAISKRVHGVKADPSGNLDLSRASIG